MPALGRANGHQLSGTTSNQRLGRGSGAGESCARRWQEQRRRQLVACSRSVLVSRPVHKFNVIQSLVVCKQPLVYLSIRFQLSLPRDGPELGLSLASRANDIFAKTALEALRLTDRELRCCYLFKALARAAFVGPAGGWARGGGQLARGRNIFEQAVEKCELDRLRQRMAVVVEGAPDAQRQIGGPIGGAWLELEVGLERKPAGKTVSDRPSGQRPCREGATGLAASSGGPRATSCESCQKRRRASAELDVIIVELCG